MGREYKLVESYNLENADVAIVCLGTTLETAILAIDQLKLRYKCCCCSSKSI